MRTIGTSAAVMATLAVLLSVGGCKKTADSDVVAGDPANVNMAPVSGGQQPPAQVLAENESATPTEQGEYEADQAPPPLPDYQQPVATKPNTIWTPGYWQHSPGGYYWVPGAWVAPPYAGALWTPGYWAADGPRYRFHSGYWGRHVGFYGGIPYGGGYGGTGYRGGYWNGGQFYYNQAVNRVDPNSIRYVYSQPEPAYAGVRVSFNGGHGGISIGPMAAEVVALREPHERPERYQFDLEHEASLRHGQFYGVNQGRPEVYIATDGFELGVGRPAVVVQQPVIVEREGPPGHAYGHYKDHGDNGRGNDGIPGNGHGKGEKDHGDEGNGHGDHGNGHGHK